MWISTLIVCAFATWLVVSPDKHSLTASRGLWGAARGWANPEYAETKTAKATKAKAGKSKAGKAKAGRAGAAQGSRWNGMLAGWNAGVTVARQRRTEGRDLWSIGSRFAGRTWGGGESLVVGARRLKTDLAAWYRGRQYAADGPVVQGTVIDDGPAAAPKTEARDQNHDEPAEPRNVKVIDGVIDGKTWIAADWPKRWVCGSCFGGGTARLRLRRTDTPEDVRRELEDRLRAARDVDPDDVVLSARQANAQVDPNQTCPLCGRRFIDIYRYDDDPRDQVNDLDVPPNGLAAETAEGAPSEGEGAPSNTINTTMPAFAGERMNLMSEMSIGELDNIGAVRAEAEAAGQLIAMLGESIAAAKAWADNLADRWAGADWGTGPLNAAVATVAEGGQALGTTELLQAGVEAIKQAVDEASALADMAAASDASGDVSRFVEA